MRQNQNVYCYLYFHKHFSVKEEMRFVYFVKYKFEFLIPVGTENLKTDFSFITSFFKSLVIPIQFS